MPTLAILTFGSMPFREDIRTAVIGLGVTWGDRLFDLFLAAVLVGLVVVLVSKTERAARTVEDLREQSQKDLAKHRNQLNADLKNHREQMQKDLAALLDSRLKPITDGLGTLQSNVSALNGRLDVLDSRITALKDIVTIPTNRT